MTHYFVMYSQAKDCTHKPKKEFTPTSILKEYKRTYLGTTTKQQKKKRKKHFKVVFQSLRFSMHSLVLMDL